MVLRVGARHPACTWSRRGRSAQTARHRQPWPEVRRRQASRRAVQQYGDGYALFLVAELDRRPRGRDALACGGAGTGMRATDEGGSGPLRPAC